MDRHIDEQNRIERLEVNIHIYDQLTLTKVPDNLMEKIFSTNGTKTTGCSYVPPPPSLRPTLTLGHAHRLNQMEHKCKCKSLN